MDASGFQQLLRDAQRRLPDAEGRLLVAVRPYLESLARAYADPTRAAESTSDLVQDVCLRLWTLLPECRAAGTDRECLNGFLAWAGDVLRTTGLNSCRNARRKKRRPLRPLQTVGAGDSMDGTAYVDPPAGGPTPSANVRAAEEAQRVGKALADLPEAMRLVVQLYYWDGLKLGEIADHTGLTYDQARERLDQGRKLLRQALEETL